MQVLNETKNLSSINLDYDELTILCDDLRLNILKSCQSARSGHTGGTLSSVELLAVLYFGGILRLDPTNPQNRDRVLVRGHLGPLRYKILAYLGFLEESELLKYRSANSILQGHEDHMITPGIDITPSGSLGMLLSYGVGASIVNKQLTKPNTTYVFLGDGEEQEGNVSEAARHAAHLKLDNLIVIVDQNKKQLSSPTSLKDSSSLHKIWDGYGWHIIHLGDGHNIEKIRSAYQIALEQQSPTLIIAETQKGKGLSGNLEHVSGYHTVSSVPKELLIDSINFYSQKVMVNEGKISKIKTKTCIFNNFSDSLKSNSPKQFVQSVTIDIQPTDSTDIDPCNAQVEYFTKLSEILAPLQHPWYFLSADVTHHYIIDYANIRDFALFIDVGLREQHMLAMAHGISVSQPDARIIINGGDAFTYRSIDQLNVLAQGKSNVVIIGDVAGLTEAKNGKTHQTSGHPGAVLTIPGVIMLEPGDTLDLFNCMNWAFSEGRGVVFIRTIRGKFPPWKRIDSQSNNIDYYLAYSVINPELTLVISGLSVSSGVEAAKKLTEYGVPTQVINVINQGALDENFPKLLPDNKPVITIYNGNAKILHGSVCSSILRYPEHKKPSKVIEHGFNYGKSGALSDLMKEYEFDEEGIISFVRRNLQINV